MPTRGLLGKRPAVHDPRTLRLGDYIRRSALPPPPAQQSWDHNITSWGMMGNDRIGDCTCAAVGHAIQLATANTAQEVTIPDSAVIAAYSAVSGYNPATGANDNGAVELDVLNLWQKTGVGGHTNSAYAACLLTNLDDVRDCINLFGYCYIGFQVPQSALEQFDAGKPWDVVANDGGIAGGHAVILVDYDATGFTAITWGQLQKMTAAFFSRYVDEAYGVVTSEWIAANGTSPSGLNLQQLLADVQQLQQAPAPAPTPPPWTPDPRIVAWLTWQAAVASYLTQAYAQDDVSDAQKWEGELAQYAPGIAALVNAAKGEATGTDVPPLPDQPPSPPEPIRHHGR